MRYPASEKLEIIRIVEQSHQHILTAAVALAPFAADEQLKFLVSHGHPISSQLFVERDPTHKGSALHRIFHLKNAPRDQSSREALGGSSPASAVHLGEVIQHIAEVWA